MVAVQLVRGRSHWVRLTAITFTHCSCKTIQQVSEKSNNSGEFSIDKIFYLINQYASLARDQLRGLVHSRYLPDCIVGSLFDRPMDEYPVGNFVTCCNSTALSRALPYFSQQHGQLSVMIHPLTQENLLDHSERAMWIGQQYPLDFSKTVPYRNPPQCVPQSVPWLYRFLNLEYCL